MKLPLTLLLLALLSAGFGYYGYSTVAGRRRFDEMAGMIPFASLFLLAPALLLAALVSLILRLRR